MSDATMRGLEVEVGMTWDEWNAWSASLPGYGERVEMTLNGATCSVLIDWANTSSGFVTVRMRSVGPIVRAT